MGGKGHDRRMLPLLFAVEPDLVVVLGRGVPSLQRLGLTIPGRGLPNLYGLSESTTGLVNRLSFCQAT